MSKLHRLDDQFFVVEQTIFIQQLITNQIPQQKQNNSKLRKLYLLLFECAQNGDVVHMFKQYLYGNLHSISPLQLIYGVKRYQHYVTPYFFMDHSSNWARGHRDSLYSEIVVTSGRKGHEKRDRVPRGIFPHLTCVFRMYTLFESVLQSWNLFLCFCSSAYL